MLPQGVNIPMPRPQGPCVPTISIAPKVDGTEGKNITIQFVGEIGDINQYTEFIDVLDNATEQDSVRIMIDSPGGDVYTTQLLVERIESCKARVTTVASGLVASAATFLWFYGHDKEVDRWSQFMHHSSLHGDWGKSLAIKEHATELVKYMSMILTDEMKAGILLAQEVQKILTNKADVQLAGATVKARIAKVKAEGETGEVDPNADTPPATTTSEPYETQTTVDDPDAQPAETTEVTEGGEGAEPQPAEGTQEVTDLAKIFAEELGIEAPPPVETPDNQPAEGGEETTTEGEPTPQPSTPEAKKKPLPKKAVKCPKCGKTKCTCKKVKGEGEEATPAPAGDPEPEPIVAPETQPGETTETGVETGEVEPTGDGEEAGTVTARCGKKGKKNKKARIGALFAELGKLLTEGDTADSDVTVGEEPEGAEPEQNKEPVTTGEPSNQPSKEGGQTGEETNAGKETAIFDLGKIFADEGLPGVGTGEGDPVKTDPGTTVVAPEKDAEQNASVEPAKGPEARVSYYW